MVSLDMKFIIFLLLAPCFMNAQNLEKHQWKNRIIAVSSPSFGNLKAEKQLLLLKADREALLERKLVIYHLTNSGYTLNFGEEEVVSHDATNGITAFSVHLIGLDGTEKFRAKELQKTQKFFGLIDAMPMRRAEIKNK